MQRPDLDPTRPYDVMDVADARRLLRRSGMPKHEITRLDLNGLHDAITARSAAGPRTQMAFVVIMAAAGIGRMVDASARILAGFRPDLPVPFNGSASSVSIARRMLGDAGEDMPLDLLERALAATSGRPVAVIEDGQFDELNTELNRIAMAMPNGRPGK